MGGLSSDLEREGRLRELKIAHPGVAASHWALSVPELDSELVHTFGHRSAQSTQ